MKTRANIAGMPPVYGRYAAMVPAGVTSLSGSSWHPMRLFRQCNIALPDGQPRDAQMPRPAPPAPRTSRTES